jgi:hypothetical protein
MGVYIDEADANESDFQHAFWGENDGRLLDIKRRIDPNDVLWCSPCVGNERWEVVGDFLFIGFRKKSRLKAFSRKG